jgi:hypothetical protein
MMALGYCSSSSFSSLYSFSGLICHVDLERILISGLFLGLRKMINHVFANEENISEIGSSGTTAWFRQKYQVSYSQAKLAIVAFSYVYSGKSFGPFGPVGFVVTR